MNEMKFDWDDLRLFLEVARGGGLAPAVASTGKSAPTLGRRMLALERRLGRELFVRMPRGYALTEAGEELLDQTLKLESRVFAMIPTNFEETPPLVKVSAGTWVTHILCGRIADIVGADRIRLRFIAADEVLDIARRETIIGIRNRRPDSLGLAGRRIARVRFAVYAVSHDISAWARVISATPSAKWLQAQATVEPVIEVTNARNALDIAQAGQSRVVLPTFIGDQIKTLLRISPPIEELEHDQWLVTHHEDRFLPEVRKVIDRIYEILKTLGTAV
ncbi:MAG: LysR family transcriptional regulator [Pseudomonadota bacterium]